MKRCNPWTAFDPQGLSSLFQTMFPAHAGDDRGVQRARESGLYAGYGMMGLPGQIAAHPKVQGSLRMAGGALEMGTGAYATVQSGGLGGALGGGALALNGADNFNAGLQTFRSGSYQQAFLEKGITDVAGNGIVGNGLYMASQLGMGFAPALGGKLSLVETAQQTFTKQLTIGEIFSDVSSSSKVHFSPSANIGSMAENGVTPSVSGQSYWFQFGDIENMTPPQVKGLIGNLAAGGEDIGAMAVPKFDDTPFSDFGRVPGTNVKEFTTPDSVPVNIKPIPKRDE